MALHEIGSDPDDDHYRRSAVQPLKDTSASTVVAGFIAMLTGYTSSLVLMFQAGQAAGLSGAEISSWIWALSIGMAVCSIGLSLRYRTPVVIAWSTPGVALLISSLPGVPYGEAIGAFIFASVLLAPFGSHGIHLATITMAICSGPEAHPNPSRRYPAAVWCGLFHGIAGVFGQR